MQEPRYFSQSYKTKKGAQLRADFENKRARPGVSQYNYSIASEGKGEGLAARAQRGQWQKALNSTSFGMGLRHLTPRLGVRI